jgi:hypothetical protein
MSVSVREAKEYEVSDKEGSNSKITLRQGIRRRGRGLYRILSRPWTGVVSERESSRREREQDASRQMRGCGPIYRHLDDGL